jgi:predicted GNAT family acetyltransferase
MGDLRKLITNTLREYLNENQTDILYKRNHNGNIVAFYKNKIVGEVSLRDYWSEIDYIDDVQIKNQIKIPNNFEFVDMIESEIENQGIATNMLKHAIDTTNKKGIAISKLFIADKAVHSIMKKLNALSIPDWYLLKK